VLVLILLMKSLLFLVVYNVNLNVMVLIPMRKELLILLHVLVFLVMNME
jgi:hypothetical protein